MNAIIELVLKLAGGIIFLFSAGYALALISGYDEYYDKMLYDDKEKDIIIKKNIKDYKNVNNRMLQASIKN